MVVLPTGFAGTKNDQAPVDIEASLKQPHG